MVGNTFSKYNDEFAYWCPDCEYKTSERVNLDIHVELNHETAPSPTNKELIDGNGKYTNYSNEWKQKKYPHTKEYEEDMLSDDENMI